MRFWRRIVPALALAAACECSLSTFALGRAAVSPVIKSIELASRHQLPKESVLQAIGPMTDTFLSRWFIRQSIDRLWHLGLFSQIWVEAIEEPDGIRLVYHLERVPFVRTIRWEGDTALDLAELAAACGLALGEAAEPSRLDQARNNLLSLYKAEGFYAAEVAVLVADDPMTNARDVTFILRSGNRYRIGAIHFHGQTGLPASELIRTFALRRGNPYSASTVQEGARKVQEHLRKTGFFTARVGLREPLLWPEKNEIEVHLEVFAGERYDVEFVGNTSLPASVLVETLTLLDSGVVDDIELQVNMRQLEAQYRERGYHFVSVKPTLQTEDPGQVIRFSIDEGPQVRVRAIQFSGNHAFDAGRLLQQMQTRPAGFLRAGVFRADVLELDMQLLVSFLQSEGFPEAQTGLPRLSFSEDRHLVDIAIAVFEGPRVNVIELEIEGSEVIPAPEIRKVVGIREHTRWNKRHAEAGRSAIRRFYAQRGFHAASVELEPVYRNGGVALIYRIQEGPQTRVGRISISGLIQTREHVIQREFTVRPGDPLNPESLIEAERELTKLGLFEVVQVGPLHPAPLPFADIEVLVRERKPWRLDLGLGYSTEEQLRGFVEVGHDNLFGTGRSLIMRERMSNRGDRTDLTFRDPWFIGYRLLGEWGVFRERREELGYHLERFGSSVGVQRDLLPTLVRGLTGNASYRLERVTRFRVEPTLVEADVQRGSQVIARLVSGLTLDRRDNPPDPARGSFHNLALDLGGIVFGSQVNFFRARLQTNWFFDWLSPTVFALSARFGYATPFAGTADVPIEDRFFAGGSTTIRGYRENRVGPLDSARKPSGGNALAIVNGEWRFPLWRFVGGALFFDSGTVARDIGALGTEFRSGLGFGLRMKTPVGPIRVDFAYALNPIQREDRRQFYITVGNPF